MSNDKKHVTREYDGMCPSCREHTQVVSSTLESELDNGCCSRGVNTYDGGYEEAELLETGDL